ncbi:10315_t:CDS:2, partial [Acaulospora colombiana]
MADKFGSHMPSESQPSTEVEEHDHELTLTSDSLFRAANGHTSRQDTELNKQGGRRNSNYPDLSKIFNQDDKQSVHEDDIVEKPPITAPEPQVSTKTSDIWCTLFRPFLLELKSKATWPMAQKVLKAAFAYWLAFVVDLVIPVMRDIGGGTFLAIVMETLESFRHLLEQETHFFLRNAYNRNTISDLYQELQGNLQNLDEARKEAQHEISFSKISQEDLNNIDGIVKNLYTAI